jgi:hypothetical protein
MVMMMMSNSNSNKSSSSGLVATAGAGGGGVSSSGAQPQQPPPSSSTVSSTSGTTRKMRRSREAQAAASSTGNNNSTMNNASSTAEELLSGYDLYEVQGNAAAALVDFQAVAAASDVSMTTSSSSSARTYNQILLSHAAAQKGVDDSETTSTTTTTTVAATTTGDLLDLLTKFEEEYNNNNRSKRDLSQSKRSRRNDFILAYNRALVLYTNNNTQACIDICGAYLHDWIQTKTKPHPDDVSMAAFRMAFLSLDVLLSLSLSGRHARPITYSSSSSSSVASTTAATTSTATTTTITEKKNFPTLTEITAWLEWCLDSVKDAAPPQLKFSLSLYKSRIDLSERDGGKHSEVKIRSARKELKVAMELYQHKLRAAFGAVNSSASSANNDTASIVSSGANSMEEVSSLQQQLQQHDTSLANSGEMLSPHVQQTAHQPQQPVGSIVLQRHNQSALNLKANLEQLKGNVTRSLILCSEANGATANNTSAGKANNDPCYYEAIHANNLGIVYGTTHKRHLALHALAKGLTHAQESRFLSDGTAFPSPTLFILYNSSIAALHAGNYLSAYECMATCVSRSSTFDQSPKCWLYMAEACLGVYYHSHHASPNSLKKFSAVEINGYVPKTFRTLAAFFVWESPHFIF